MYSFRALSSPDDTTDTTGRHRLEERAGEIGRAVVRDLEDLGLEAQVAAVVRARQDSLGLVVQVAGEEEAERRRSVSRKHDRVAVDRVRGRFAREAGASQAQRLVADAGPGWRLAQERQARARRRRRRDGPQHLDLDVLVGEEVEGVVVAEGQPAELDRAARAVQAVEGRLPVPEGLVHLARRARRAGSSSRPVMTGLAVRPCAGRARAARRPAPLAVPRRRTLDQAVVVDAPRVDEQPLARRRGSSVSDRWISVRPTKWSASPWVTRMQSISLGLVGGGAAEPAGQVAGEQLVVAAVDQHRPCPSGVSMTAPSPCWTSTKSTLSTRAADCRP